MKRLSTLLILLFSAVAHAEVVYDGTQGASGSVDLDVNNTYLVDASDGNTFAAPNVFFSFSNMNVEAGNTLLFTNSSGARYDNLIARVTGGSPSLIDGSIASEVQGANLWIVNPYGMVFGNGSSVNVMGSFHVSTADYIEFEGGIRYAATNTGSDFLVDGNPTKLGFLDKVPQQNGEITLSNTKITVGEGESISLI
ncbi:MAG: filamentous hemagglutinin N-terminal domain-containing protein, partial [Gammaproteobacteria bacterium]|nr:filamentous hemagglutinin N-terminal domain-containing protein [Gammaproteobacteria bacterium]